MADEEPVLISALNAYLYCDRRCALRHTEGLYVHNEHTVKGDQQHQHVDEAGQERSGEARIVRGMPLVSHRLGLAGRADAVEMREGRPPVPVEYKKGPRRKWDNDDVQLCAQGLCLEEMMGVAVPMGAIFHQESRRRREVQFTAALRAQTESVIGEVRELLASGRLPAPVLKPQCDGCSLRGECVPELGAVRLPPPHSLFVVQH